MTEVEDPTVQLNPFEAVEIDERQRIYGELARSGPVLRIELPGPMEVWLVTGYAEARAAMSDPRLVKVKGPTFTLAEQVAPDAEPGLGSHMLLRDGAEHARLRRLVGAVFTRRRVDSLAPRISEIVGELLDAAERQGQGQVDLIQAFALPLAMTVICDLIGVPEKMRPRFRDHIEALIAGVFVDPQVFAQAVRAEVALARELVAQKRSEPADDLLSALVAVHDEGGDRLTDDELTSMVSLLVLAGHETTVNLIANATYALLTHPDQLAILRAKPDLMADAVEELLRWDGPAAATFLMRATEPLELGGIALDVGALVLPALLAANRDLAHDPAADTLDVTREYTPHVAFGHGIHHCLGAPLARLEARIALSELISRFPALRLAVGPETLRRRPNIVLNAMEALPVALR